MEIDSFYTKGSSHTECQDYALSGSFKNLKGEPQPYAVISDGCSSSPHSDLGARLLSFGYLLCLKLFYVEPYGIRDLTAVSLYAENHVKTYEGLLALSPHQASPIDATMLGCTYHDSLVEVSTSGDGYVLARKRESGEWVKIKISFNESAPAYLSYGLSKKRFQKYYADYGVRTLHRVDGPDQISVEVEKLFHAEEDFALYPSKCTKQFNFSEKDYDLILVASDGLDSFLDSSGKHIEDTIILKELLSFKNFKGNFIQRRVGAFLSRTCKKNGWTHYDDLSVSGLYLPLEQ